MGATVSSPLAALGTVASLGEERYSQKPDTGLSWLLIHG